MSIVITEDRGAVRHVVLNRPEKRNAMNQELLRALGDALREAGADAVGALRRAARRGPRLLRRRRPRRAGATRRRARGMLRPFRNVFLDCANLCEEMAKPVVCQIHRTCVGGALEVALGCDLRIASERRPARPARGQVRDHPRRRRLHRLPAVVGLGRAKELIMTARMIDAAEAAAHRPRQPRRRAGGARGGHAGARRRAARELARRGRPRQARDRRLRAPGARADARDGGRGAGVLRRGDARDCARAARARSRASPQTAQAESRRLSRGQRAEHARRRRRDAQRQLPPARPRACGCRAAGRGSPAHARAHASSASRSMPVSMPISSQHRDEILGGDVAGRAGRHRAAAELAEARLEARPRRPPAPRARSRDPARACCGSARSARRPSPSSIARAARRTRPPGAGWPSRSCRRSRSPARRRRAGARAISSTRSGGT